jgi:endonuclease/exonuclease/phosphatase family metal-dependent hydrolase
MSVVSSAAFSVVTFNVRMSRTDDGEDAWPLRKDCLTALLRTLAPDILCVQEPYIEQIDAIAAALPGHRRIGVGRDDGREAGEWSAIFVGSGRLTVEAEGDFWLSETPDVAGSRSWDALRHPRLCTWAELSERETGKRLRVYNAHWDHVGTLARMHSAGMIAARLADLPAGIPAIVTGDFNAEPASDPVRYLTGGVEIAAMEGYPQSPRLLDAYFALAAPDAPEGTFHGFGGRSDGPRIDYILLTAGIEPESCEIVRSSCGGRFPSDHFPVHARLRLL